MSETEKFCIRGILFDQDTTNIDLAFRLCHKTKATDEEIIHKMALRWLRSEEVREYIEDECGYEIVHGKGNTISFQLVGVLITEDLFK